jgi:methylenetetrahydrofolate reductase (NADPH)
MSNALMNENWDQAAQHITDQYSIEITAKDIDSFPAIANSLPAGTSVAVTFLPGETIDARVAAAKMVRELGFDPLPHFSARRLKSMEEFKNMLERMVNEAGATRCFVVAGDPSEPDGPFADTSSMIETGLFEAHGIKTIGIAGHPEGHPNMTDEECLQVLKSKCDMIEQRGMTPMVVTQFGFDSQAFLNWLAGIRDYGIHAQVRLGVPGPTSIKTLMKFAARCGVSASTSVLTKYGISITKLLGTAGPDKMVDDFANSSTAAHGNFRLHFYPFGGLSKTLEWVQEYRK